MNRYTKDEAKAKLEAAIQREIDDPKNQEYERTERSHLHSSDESFFVVGRKACRTIMLCDSSSMSSEVDLIFGKSTHNPIIKNDDENDVEHKRVLVVFHEHDRKGVYPAYERMAMENFSKQTGVEFVLLEDF